MSKMTLFLILANGGVAAMAPPDIALAAVAMGLATAGVGIAGRALGERPPVRAVSE